jgi:uncharacterized protein (TIGR01777 family)
MHLLIAGGTGLIGRALSSDLISDGHQVTVLTRAKQEVLVPEGVQTQLWDARTTESWAHQLEQADVMINLAGENLAGSGLLPQRWSDEQKLRIRQSRLQSGSAITQAFLAATKVPRVLIQASGVGYYGPLGDEAVTEGNPPGSDFLARLAVDWEASTSEVEQRGTRRVIIRTGAVLSTKGGALPKLLLPYQLFVGGPLGNGRQYLSWIHIDDEIGAIRFLIDNESASGAFNLVAPNPLTNSEFGKTIGRVLHRPSLLPTPGFALRILLGEVSTLVLDGQRAQPEHLLRLGYRFRFADAETALRDLLNK